MTRFAFLLASSVVLAACTNSPQPGPLSASRTAGDVIDDASIKLALNRDLRNAFSGVFLDIGTEVREARVLLAGTVRTPEERVEASRLAWQIRGVRDVVNELQVSERKSFAAHAKDSRITQQLRLRMATARDVQSLHYNIETVNSTVYILGTARDRRELERVAFLAATISGVEQVVSHAILADDPRRTPQPI